MKTLAICALLLAAPLAGATEEVERLEAWPALDGSQKRAAKTELKRLRASSTPEMETEARAALVELGPGIVPLTAPVLGKEKDEETRERLVSVLDELVGARHTRLLAEHFDSKAAEERIWALTACARFPDAGVREQADAAWAAVTRAKEKDRAAEGEELAAALALASSGSLDGLEPLFAEARDHWSRSGGALHVALGAARSPEATSAVLARSDGSRKDLVAALRLLGACGDPETAPAGVRPHLDSSDGTVLLAAVNALRGIVDGEPPIERLSTFEAIELAGKWKERLDG
jgi:hypothetical protein